MPPSGRTSSKRLAQAKAAADAVGALAGQLEQAELVAAAADAARTTSVAAVNERRRLREGIDEKAAAIVELEGSAAEASEELTTAAEVRQEADAVAEEARSAVEAAQARAALARRAVDQIADRDEADRLASLLAKIAVAQRDLDSANADLAGIALTGEGMRAIETASSAVDVAMGQVDLVSAHIELVAIADIEVRLGGESVALPAGGTWTTSVSAQTEIDIPGVLTARAGARHTGVGDTGQTRCRPRGSGDSAGERRCRRRRRGAHAGPAPTAIDGHPGSAGRPDRGTDR